MNLSTLRNNPAAFRSALLIDSDGGPRKLGAVLDPWQRTDFEALDNGWRRVSGIATEPGPCYLRAWLERGRGHSKTGDIAAMVSWVLFASSRKLSGVAAAGDQDQAGLLRDAVEKLCRLNPWLAKILDVQASRVVNRHTGSELHILTSDAPTSYGLTPDFIVCDEITHWKNRDLWDSLLSAAAKRANCLLLVITNAGHGDTWQWETREAIRADAGWYFSRLEGPVASWITPDRLAEQRRLLPSLAYRRLWGNQWTSGSGDALLPSDIERAITLAGPGELEPGWAAVAGLDLGLVRDHSALCIIAKHVGFFQEAEKAASIPISTTKAALIDLGLLEEHEETSDEGVYFPPSNRVRLLVTSKWRPNQRLPATQTQHGEGKVQIAEIEAAILELHSRFSFALHYDPHQCEFLGQRLRQAGIDARPCEFTGPNLRTMAQEVLTSFAEGTVDLYPEDSLIRELLALRAEEKSYGVRLTSLAGRMDTAT